MNRSFLTVGHSTRTIAEFIEILTDARVSVIADVRKLRGSRAHPHFNEDVLANALRAEGIGYTAIEDLGGRRPRTKDVEATVNGWWQNQSFHHYADYGMTDDFAAGLDELCEVADDVGPVAIMCAEAVWWRCHRRIIADHLLARGEEVAHLMDVGEITQATLSEGAHVGPHARVTYPEDGRSNK